MTDLDNTLPIKYWLSKMPKTPVGDRFIVASIKCRTQALSDNIPKIFKIIFNIVGGFLNKSFFCSSCKNFWV